MKKLILLLIISIGCIFIDVSGQGLPPGECGILFSYDATGSLIKREYVCNNTPEIMERQGKLLSTEQSNEEEELLHTDKQEVIGINAVVPNPTTGRFSIRLARPVQNAAVLLLDGNGSVLERKKSSGNKISFDIGRYAAGVYYVTIKETTTPITFKVIKR